MRTKHAWVVPDHSDPSRHHAPPLAELIHVRDWDAPSFVPGQRMKMPSRANSSPTLRRLLEAAIQLYHRGGGHEDGRVSSDNDPDNESK